MYHSYHDGKFTERIIENKAIGIIQFYIESLDHEQTTYISDTPLTSDVINDVESQSGCTLSFCGNDPYLLVEKIFTKRYHTNSDGFQTLIWDLFEDGKTREEIAEFLYLNLERDADMPKYIYDQSEIKKINQSKQILQSLYDCKCKCELDID
jgi:hypothetical protein